MQIHTQEHADMIADFERNVRPRGRLDKEDKSQWPRGFIYQDGMVNVQFLAFRHGYSVARCKYMEN